MTFDLERGWQLDGQVALRPEPFGALAYHFGNRQLSFLKTRKLVDVVRALGDYASAREACRAVSVSAEELPAYQQALGSLVASGMVVEKGRA
jgi:mycofactocin biosynthesis protein MftB